MPFPSPGDLPDPGVEPRSPALQADALPSEPPGKILRGGNNTQRTMQKRSHDPDNHDGVITHLEPNILEWEVKWALESITKNGHIMTRPHLWSPMCWWASLVAQRVKCLPAMQETWVRSLGQEDPLEKEMATHSSTLAWKIPWTEKPGRLQSMGSQRVGHN